MTSDIDLVNTAVLFEESNIGGLTLRNRIAMAPMTRGFSPSGVPGQDVAEYYRRRAQGGLGLIITEGTWIPHPTASNDDNVPCLYGDDAMAGWREVVRGVHEAGSRIFAQLWHIGQYGQGAVSGIFDTARRVGTLGPSGVVTGEGMPPGRSAQPATLAEIDEVIAAYAEAAANARDAGFDGIEVHAGHGYLIDQFFFAGTNLRTDHFGGGIRQRSRFGAEVVRAIRERVGATFPISFRFSQWKQHDYTATLVDNPNELTEMLEPLTDAGVSLFHCSQRRYWEGEFGTDLNLAGWTKKLTGVPTMSVGSVTLRESLADTNDVFDSPSHGIERLIELMERGDFDLIAIGRSLLSNPDWVQKVRAGSTDQLNPFTTSVLSTLH